MFLGDRGGKRKYETQGSVIVFEKDPKQNETLAPETKPRWGPLCKVKKYQSFSKKASQHTDTKDRQRWYDCPDGKKWMALALLEDVSTYKKVKQDPTKKLERKNNKLVKKLYDRKFLDYRLKRHLTIHNSIAPKFYRMAKIHKLNVPLRPVISCTKSPSYFLYQFIAGIL